MANKSLGLIEVVGLAAALEAADAAVKAANVELIGYEFTKGGGLVLIKLQGNVGAVKAGVEAGSMAARKVNKVLSTLIIPRPHQQLTRMLGQDQILKVKKEPITMVSIDLSVSEHEDEVIEASGTEPELPADTKSGEEGDVQAEGQDDNLTKQVIETSSSELNHGDDGIVIVPTEKKPADICNLCNDPACHRKKGDPKITCIYYVKNN